MKITLRIDPSSGLAHYGTVRTYPYERAWATLCRRGSGIDTVFWSPCLDNEVTCLWCVLKELT